MMTPETRAIAFETLHRLDNRYDATESIGELLREIKVGIEEQIG